MTYSIVARDADDRPARGHGADVHAGGRLDRAVGARGHRRGGDAIDRGAGLRAAVSRRARRGASAAEALEVAQAADPMTALRQVGVVDRVGRVAATTGALCIDHTGDVAGEGFSVQANMMASPEVWPAMAAAYTDSTGPLAHRLLYALNAGEAAGGDARGHMSAALLVVEGTPSEQPGGGTVVNLRVDRSDDPLGDLSELLTAADAFAGFGRAVDQLMGGDPVAALATVDDALLLLPGEGNMRSIRSGALVASGATEAGVAAMRTLIDEHAAPRTLRAPVPHVPDRRTIAGTHRLRRSSGTAVIMPDNGYVERFIQTVMRECAYARAFRSSQAGGSACMLAPRLQHDGVPP